MVRSMDAHRQRKTVTIHYPYDIHIFFTISIPNHFPTSFGENKHPVNKALPLINLPTPA